MSNILSKPLRSYPVQLIDIDNGVAIRRGNQISKVQGQNAVNIVKVIIESTQTEEKTIDEILQLFPAAYHLGIQNLIENLISKNILYFPKSTDDTSKPLSNSNLETFFWNFNKSAEQVHAEFSQYTITIVGVNYISKQMVTHLHDMGLENFSVIDYPQLRNINFFDEKNHVKSSKWPIEKVPLISDNDMENFFKTKKPHCLVATSDFGGLSLLRQWQSFCFEKELHFFPITLQNSVGYLGPLVIPRQTACYECFMARCNSNLEEYETLRKVEEVAFEGQNVSGFHPSMATILADFALIELSKFYGHWCLSPNLTNAFIKINMLDNRLMRHKVLKIPKCSLCSSLNNISPITPNKLIAPPLVSLSR